MFDFIAYMGAESKVNEARHSNSSGGGAQTHDPVATQATFDRLREQALAKKREAQPGGV